MTALAAERVGLVISPLDPKLRDPFQAIIRGRRLCASTRKATQHTLWIVLLCCSAWRRSASRDDRRPAHSGRDTPPLSLSPVEIWCGSFNHHNYPGVATHGDPIFVGYCNNGPPHTHRASQPGRKPKVCGGSSQCECAYMYRLISRGKVLAGGCNHSREQPVAAMNERVRGWSETRCD